MIYSLWYKVITEYKAITGTGILLVLFVLAAGYETARQMKDKKRVDTYGLPLSVFAAIGVGIASVINIDLKKSESAWAAVVKRMIIIGLCVFMVVISGKRIISPVFLSKAENDMHVSQSLIDAMNVIINDCDKTEICVMTMPGVGEYFTAYSSRFKLLYEDPKDGDLSELPDKVREAYTQLCEKNPDMRVVANAAKAAGCDYIVFDTDAYWPDIPLTSLGYEVIASCENRDVYKYVGTGGNP